jgi:hypothetical protein
MPRGGRSKGSRNRKTLERQRLLNKARATAIHATQTAELQHSKLVMREAMTLACGLLNEAMEAERLLIEAGVTEGERSSARSDVLLYLKLAQHFAAELAPYENARLAAVTHSGETKLKIERIEVVHIAAGERHFPGADSE